jgi:hypothetical protein
VSECKSVPEFFECIGKLVVCILVKDIEGIFKRASANTFKRHARDAVEDVYVLRLPPEASA